MRIGFIGIGSMGRPMSINLLRAGYELTVYDIRDEAMEAPVRLGAKAATSPKEVARASDVVLTSLPTPEAVEEVVLGADGVLEGALKGGILVDTSTIPPSTIKKIWAEAKDRGLSARGVPLFVTSVARQVYELARARGMGRLDHTAVIRLLEEAAQVEVRF